MVNVYSLLSSISSFCSFAFWGVSIDNYKNKIGEITGKILCGESIEKETVVKLIDLLHVLKSTSCYLEETEELITGTCKTLKVFSNNEKICSMVLKHVFKGTKADGNFSHSHIANREKWHYLIWVYPETVFSENSVIKIIVDTMIRFINSPDVCCNGCSALNDIIGNS